MDGIHRKRAWYEADLSGFLPSSEDAILGELLRGAEFDLTLPQRDAWTEEIRLLKVVLAGRSGVLHLEFGIPRMGTRADAVAILGGRVVVIEFKIGERRYSSDALDQVYDYAMDLKNFHEGSHGAIVMPILVATEAETRQVEWREHPRILGLYEPVCANRTSLGSVLDTFPQVPAERAVDPESWARARYLPTPTIIEAAQRLYAGHGVMEISRHGAEAINLDATSSRVSAIIEEAARERRKAICFVTGVPGAGKTLVGLNIATQHSDAKGGLHSVFLSGNGPLVKVLREALARDSIRREKEWGRSLKKGEARGRVKAFIQNVHNFRDECLDRPEPPADHVAIFDEAQRAWNLEQTAYFMRRKKGRPGFDKSEPEFLVSCMHRHADWAVVVCLVGGGQEINTGEAGIGEWIAALKRSFQDWHVHLPSELHDSEYGASDWLDSLASQPLVHYHSDLHLAVSMRSFRAAGVSAFVKAVLDCEEDAARSVLRGLAEYPLVVTRSLDSAKRWLKRQASGSERYGLLVSSQAERLKPHAIDVRTPVDPVKWFLDGKHDVRSSYYLEDVATEFHTQGLELDWACVCWDGDFRRTADGWQHFSFRGSKWLRVLRTSRQQYLKNAYRVLLTRARQGMVICVPEGVEDDPTRSPRFYNETYRYLRGVGIPELA